MATKRAPWNRPAPSQLPAKLEADEAERHEGVGEFCPCHAGWEVFEQNVSFVLRSLRDPNQKVRFDARHVFDDASRMQIAAELRDCLFPRERKLGEKRASSFYRSMQERLEAKRAKQNRKQKDVYRAERRAKHH